jgi:hypothetical protein
MSDIEDSTNLISFWRERLENSADWNSLPRETRKKLLFDFQRGIKALADLDVSQEELLQLIQLTDVPTVFDAVISMIAAPNFDKNKYRALAYLKQIVLNSEKGRISTRTYHIPPPNPKRKGKIADINYVRQYNPYDFKSQKCKFCGNKINSSNTTGVCTKCQQKGRNGN